MLPLWALKAYVKGTVEGLTGVDLDEAQQSIVNKIKSTGSNIKSEIVSELESVKLEKEKYIERYKYLSDDDILYRLYDCELEIRSGIRKNLLDPEYMALKTIAKNRYLDIE